MKRFGLGPRDRLRLRKEIEAVFREGRKVVGRDVVVWTRRRDEGELPRLAVVVSRRLGGAVRRNRLKRLVREAFRLNKERLDPRSDVVVHPRPGCAWRVLRDAEGALLEAWRRARIYGEKAGP